MGPSPQSKRPRVLFMGEAVTLSHVGRPLILADALDSTRWDVFFACDQRFHWMVQGRSFPWLPLTSISPKDFLQALNNPKGIYTEEALTAYVKDDLELISNVKPDLVVGDFRLSLLISARAAGLPYAQICNAHWSPYATGSCIAPDYPCFSWLGEKAGQTVFEFVSPWISKWHVSKINRVGKKFGIKLSVPDIKHLYTDSALTLYADDPRLVPTNGAPPSHSYVGPLAWSPAVPLPTWWNRLPSNKPIIYVNFGSSGPVHLLPVILKALSSMPVSILAATAGRLDPFLLPSDVFAADYLPGDKCSAMAAMVLTNGGAPPTYQALQKGKPVIAIASNMDQLMFMQYVEKAQAGVRLRTSTLNPDTLKQTAARVLKENVYTKTARELSRSLASLDPASTFPKILSKLLV